MERLTEEQRVLAQAVLDEMLTLALVMDKKLSEGLSESLNGIKQ